MLVFTAGGVVSTPTVLQIRVTKDFPDRIRAGAPLPARGMSSSEIRANIRHFTVGRAGPRTQPCTALVLSGVGLGNLPDLAAIVDESRGWGVDRVTLHLGPGHDLGSLTPDAVAVVVRSGDDVARFPLTSPVTAVVLLDAPTLPHLADLAHHLAAAGPARVVLTWPLIGDRPVPAAAAAAALGEPLAILDAAGIPVGVKGLPACALGAHAHRLWRSGNRFYVDADNQLDDALLFFPDVVRFAKRDVCRFCPADARCDGAPEAWVAEGLVTLHPLDA